MNHTANCLRKCEALTNLMVNYPKRLGLSLKEASQKCKINLYKYQKNDSYPLVTSLFYYSDAFNLNPDALLRLACLVEDHVLSEDQAMEILLNWQALTNPDFLGNSYHFYGSEHWRFATGL
ncbi:MAG: hypothetical protein M0P69_13495 [Bacteroidales bacterium]|jgi:hypothetical protein|nr:hypothetical protein [Bacteroidales bacterium]MDD2261967.1 hypothetical protein [Clostridia bacterium]MDD2813762.1 hypothetical protein [Bacteroidales bacterium]MDD4813792.1 hypothetical protein [Bacteroidales bacterium]